MYDDTGDEFMIGSNRFPLLLWMQVLVMFLLVILLYLFSFSAVNFSGATSVTAASTAFLTSNIEETPLDNSNSCLHRTNKVKGNQRIEETGASTSKGIGREDNQEREGSSSKSVSHISDFGLGHHPCQFFVFARKVFLKCLGLDSALPRNRKHRREG